MLATFEHWPDLMDELKIEILKLFIVPKLNTLLNFSVTSKQSRTLLIPVWQEAIRRFFPVIEETYAEDFRSDPQALFAYIARNSANVLQCFKLKLSNYITYVTSDVPSQFVIYDNLSVIHGMMCAAGHSKKLLTSQITDEVRYSALVFSVFFGKKDELISAISSPSIPNRDQSLRQSLELALTLEDFDLIGHFEKHRADLKQIISMSFYRDILLNTCRFGREKLLTFLLTIYPIKYPYTVICEAIGEAITNKQQACAIMMLNHNKDVIESLFRRVLTTASKCGLVNLVSNLLKIYDHNGKRGDILHALEEAGESDQPAVMNILLLELKGNPSYCEIMKIVETPGFKNLRITKEVLFPGIDFDQKPIDESTQVKNLREEIARLNLLATPPEDSPLSASRVLQFGRLSPTIPPLSSRPTRGQDRTRFLGNRLV